MSTRNVWICITTWQRALGQSETMLSRTHTHPHTRTGSIYHLPIDKSYIDFLHIMEGPSEGTHECMRVCVCVCVCVCVQRSSFNSFLTWNITKCLLSSRQWMKHMYTFHLILHILKEHTFVLRPNPRGRRRILQIRHCWNPKRYLDEFRVSKSHCPP